MFRSAAPSLNVRGGRLFFLRIVLGAGIVGAGLCCTRQEAGPGVQDEIRIGVAREPLGALLVLAVEKRFFESEGIGVTVVDKYPSGKRAMQGLLNDEVDIVAAAEVPIVFCSFEKQDFRIVATIGSSDNEPRIVGRKDRGIEKGPDLAGKRIATQNASAVHYFLHLFLLRNGISEKDVALFYMKAEELPHALSEGKIDAFSMREPYVGEAKELLGKDAVSVLQEPGLYVKTFNLVAREPVVRGKSESLRRVLRALIRAEDFARQNVDEAVRLVASRLEMDPVVLAELWAGLQFRVSLGQELLGTLEDEASWAMDNGLVDAKEVPNYLDFVDVGALEAVEPSAVTVIH